MRSVAFLVVLTLLAFGAQRSFATEQDDDRVIFQGKQRWMLERPLNDFLGTLPVIPRYDVRTTGSWKGYTVEWEIKDSRLYLTHFEATQKGKPVPITSLFPNQKAPFLAKWYSGKLHVITGAVEFNPGGVERPVYAHLTVLTVTNGVVIKTNVLRDISEEKLKL